MSSRENVFIGPRDGSPGRRLIQMLTKWRRRMRSRGELARLTDLDLKDIGYPDRAETEKAKPFWRA
jgi:uncharacterized protein YjiS (DUF1127 family)